MNGCVTYASETEFGFASRVMALGPGGTKERTCASIAWLVHSEAERVCLEERARGTLLNTDMGTYSADQNDIPIALVNTEEICRRLAQNIVDIYIRPTSGIVPEKGMLVTEELVCGAKQTDIMFKLKVSDYYDLPDVAAYVDGILDGNDSFLLDKDEKRGVELLREFAKSRNLNEGIFLPVGGFDESWKQNACLEIVELGTACFCRLYSAREFLVSIDQPLFRTVKIERNGLVRLATRELGIVTDIISDRFGDDSFRDG